MKISKFTDEKSWLEARLGRITGTRLKDLVSKGNTKKIGYYEILAERISIPASEENVMDRGKRLEDVAVELFKKKTGKKVKNELVIWHRDDDENIAYSPDASIGMTECVEVKCLSSARHLEAYITKKIPSEYWYQVLQSFIVNDKQKKLYFTFYDPRSPVEIFWIEVTRKEVQEEVKEYLELERQVLKEIANYEKNLTF
jgi:predicted phage-related endonuclease